MKAVFEPRELSARTALDFLEKAASVQYDPGNDVFFGLDIAAGSFYRNGKYLISEENLSLSSDEVIDYYEKLFSDYKIIYLKIRCLKEMNLVGLSFSKEIQKNI
jgi:enolase